VRPIEQADLQSKVTGYVQRIYVDRGDHVERGDLLATIRPSELPEQVTQAREQVGQAEAQFRLQKQNADRARDLYGRGLMSKAELDNAEAQLAVATAQHAASLAGLGVVSTRLGETSIVAPFSGWVTRRYVDPGALVAPGPTSQNILQLMRIERVRVFVSVLEKDVPSIRKGLHAHVTVDALPGRHFEGEVTRFSPALDPATRTLEVEVQVPNPEEPLADGNGKDRPLKPGMYGHAALRTAVHPHALVLPIDAVVTEEEARSVFVVEGGRAKRVPVVAGFDGGDWLEIVSGLHGDEQVILTGIDLVSDGAPVAVARPTDAAAPNSPPRARTEGKKNERVD
jgi:membrane fusion protein (multidrug efflux system)